MHLAEPHFVVTLTFSIIPINPYFVSHYSQRGTMAKVVERLDVFTLAMICIKFSLKSWFISRKGYFVRRRSNYYVSCHIRVRVSRIIPYATMAFSGDLKKWLNVVTLLMMLCTERNISAASDVFTINIRSDWHLLLVICARWLVQR